MGPERRDGAGQGRRIPIPPTAAPPEVSKAQQLPMVKSGIPSPRRRSAGGFGRGKEVTSAAILSASNPSGKRPIQPPANKISKSLLRPSTSQSYEDKDDVRQRDNGQKDCYKKDSGQRDKALKDSGPRRLTLPETINVSDSGKRVLKQPSLLLKSGVATCPMAPPSVCTSKPTPGAAIGKQPLPRSVSTTRDRLSNDTRTSMMRRSMSVGKGRTSAPQPEQLPQQAGARFRPVIERATSASAAGAPYRHTADKRDVSAARLRPASASGKSDTLLPTSGKAVLTTITEAPARPVAQTHVATTSIQKPAVQSRPVFSLNLTALKQQPALSAPPLPPVDSCASLSTEESGPPVPKLDLGGILQRRAEEQASEPVFMVAPSSEDAAQLSASATQPPQQDKRKSGSRQPSAKEEPAEHFYLYPKVQPQEKKRIDEICRVMPKRQQVAVTDLFGKMVEARQNCEQMCFRGHRLLDQAQTEFKSRLAQKEEEVAQTKEEAAQWRQEAEFLRTQLAMLLGGARQPEECADDSSTAQGQLQEGSDEEQRAAYLRSSLLSTFDSMAQLGAGVVAEAYDGEEQGDADG